jgi:translation initiation factor RLI1
MENMEEVLDVLGMSHHAAVRLFYLTLLLTSWLELNHIMDRDVNLLSGGELQRFAIGTVCVQQADVYVS